MTKKYFEYVWVCGDFEKVNEMAKDGWEVHLVTSEKYKVDSVQMGSGYDIVETRYSTDYLMKRRVTQKNYLKQQRI